MMSVVNLRHRKFLLVVKTNRDVILKLKIKIWVQLNEHEMLQGQIRYKYFLPCESMIKYPKQKREEFKFVKGWFCLLSFIS